MLLSYQLAYAINSNNVVWSQSSHTHQDRSGSGAEHMYLLASFQTPVIDHLQYADIEGEGLGDLVMRTYVKVDRG